MNLIRIKNFELKIRISDNHSSTIIDYSFFDILVKERWTDGFKDRLVNDVSDTVASEIIRKIDPEESIRLEKTGILQIIG